MVPVLALVALAGQGQVQVVVSCKVVALPGPAAIVRARSISKKSGSGPIVAIVEAADYEKVLAKALQDPKAKVLSAPVIRTFSGFEATISTTVKQDDGELVRSIKVNPRATAGGKIDFSYSLETSVSGKAEQKRSDTGRVSLGAGEAVVVLSRKPESDGTVMVTYLKPERVADGK